MAKTFDFATTPAPPDSVKTNDKGHAEVVFNVVNTTNRPARCMARVRASESTKQEWLNISGESDRDLGPGSTEPFTVTFDAPIVVPPPGGPKPATPPPATPPPTGTGIGTAEGDKYSFRLEVASANNPDEDFTVGPIVRVELAKPKPVAEKKPFPKWILIPIAAVVLIGIAVGLYFALRKTDVAVPNVVGMKLDDAKAALVAAELTPVEQEIQITGTVAPGQVIAQNPKPDSTPVPKNTEVQLITEGEVPLVEVPDVTKRLSGDAKTRLLELGFSVVEKGTDVTPGLQPNQVVSQDPVGGTKVKPESTIALVVAVQRQTTVPDVVFKPMALAQQQIRAVGLNFVEKNPEVAPANVAPGNVKSQNPAAGTRVPPGSSIELVAAAQPTTVPSVRGRRIADAQIILQQQGLDLGTVDGTVDESNASIALITAQFPLAGTVVARGSTVNVSVPFRCVGTGIRRCVELEDRLDRVDIGTIRRLDPTIRQPLFQRKQPLVQKKQP